MGDVHFFDGKETNQRKPPQIKFKLWKKLSFHTMLKTRYAQTVKQKTYSMIMFFNNLTITAKFYNAEVDYVLLEKFPHSIDVIFIV